MLLYYLYNFSCFCNGMIIFTLLATACTGYAYYIDSQRPDDDPKKRYYQLGAVLFAPFTWPFFLIAFVSLFLIRALFYGFFLILFTVILIITPPKRSEPLWVEKTANRIGETLLRANMQLIKLFIRPWTNQPETI